MKKRWKVIESNNSWHTENWNGVTLMDVETIGGKTLYAYGYYVNKKNAIKEAEHYWLCEAPVKLVKFNDGCYHVYTSKEALFDYYGRALP